MVKFFPLRCVKSQIFAVLFFIINFISEFIKVKERVIKVIKTENLNYIYQPGMPYEKHALCDVNIEIPDGDFTAVIGHTGSGKSTLIQHLNGLIKPTSGKIIIDGTDITAPGTDMKSVRKKVGLVFQYPEHQLFEETVYRDIAFGPKNMGLSEEEIKERVIEAARLVNLDEELLESSPFELSGGQKRRAAIAGVLSMHPKILILDEPTAGLDPKGRDSLLALLTSLHEKLNMTVILVSHSMEDVAKVAKNIIVMNGGKVFMHASVPEVFERGEELINIGLNVPQITQLFNRLIGMGADLPRDIYTVKYAAGILEKKMKEKFE